MCLAQGRDAKHNAHKNTQDQKDASLANIECKTEQGWVHIEVYRYEGEGRVESISNVGAAAAAAAPDQKTSSRGDDRKAENACKHCEIVTDWRPKASKRFNGE